MAKLSAKDRANHAIVQMAITDDELNKLLDTEVNTVLKDKEDEIMAHLIPVCRKSFNEDLETPALVGFADFPEPGDKRRDAFFGLGHKLAEELFYAETPALNPVAILFTSEMWYLDHEKPDNGLMISEQEDRREGVVVHVLTVDGRGAMALLDINRDKNGKLINRTVKLLVPYKLGSGSVSESYLGAAFFQGVAKYTVAHPPKGGKE